MKFEASAGTAAILVIDNDRGVADMLGEMLEPAGIRVHRSATGREALTQLQEAAYDLVVLELMLPDMDGLVLCTRIRERSAAPILVCTRTQRRRDKVLALKLGADDFLSKPVDPDELEVRVNNLIRRHHVESHTADNRTDDTLRLGILSVDQARRRATLAHETVALTPTEYRLLVALLADSDAVHSREELALKVWGYADASDGRTIDVHMRRLRAKLQQTHHDAPRIVSVRGFGYQIVGESERPGLHVVA